jgi:hypothetical protein
MERSFKVKIEKVRRRSIRVFAVRAQCPLCERRVETLSVAEAVSILAVDAETVNQLIACGRVHAINTASGGLRICQDSLFVQ